MNKYFLCLTCSVLALTCSHLVVAGPLKTSHTHNTLELKPISSLEDSYHIAATVFLPDAEDGFGFGSNNLNDNVSSRDNCSGFSLSSCPAHAKCLKCTFDNKYKITSCDTNYKQSGNACVAQTCSEINAGYKDSVPTNQICTISGKCYSSCKAIDFSNYPLDSCPAGVICTPHPDCSTSATTKGNCSPVKQKATGCTVPTQKLNDANTACIDKDDTCPADYFKSCETGTQGDTKYTEKGTACYQCKPACNIFLYKYDASNCMSPNELSGNQCSGKYERCEIPCGSEYKYDENNCAKSNYKVPCGQHCNGKYTKCLSSPYNSVPFNYGGMKFVRQTAIQTDCPNNPPIFNTFPYLTITYDNYHACYTGSPECADIYVKMLDTGTASLDKDLFCGNMKFTFSSIWLNKYGKKFDTYTLNGNGHTILFDKPYEDDFQTDSNIRLLLNDLKITHKISNRIAMGSCGYLYDSYVFNGAGELKNVDITSDIGLIHALYNDKNEYDLKLYGTNNFVLNNLVKTYTYDDQPHVDGLYQINILGTLNFKDKTEHNGPYVHLQLDKIYSGGTLNYMGNNSISFTPKEDAVANICSTEVRKYVPFSTMGGTTALKVNIRSNEDCSNCTTYNNVGYTMVPDLCEQDVFSGTFWK